jgi:hypothetical protein
MKVLKIENNFSGYSVWIQDGEIRVWVDVWIYIDEIRCDWNMYIFDIWNSIDIEIKAYQENEENAEKCFSMAVTAIDNYTETI